MDHSTEFDRIANRLLSEAEADAAAQRIINEELPPTSFRDPSPLPTVGDTPPVPQPDSRLVPAWATGIAVASLGIGAGVTGIGCGAWLILQGLSAISLVGVVAIAAPFVGVAAIATAIGAAASKANTGTTTHVYEGPVTNRTTVTTTSHTRGMFSRTRNTING